MPDADDEKQMLLDFLQYQRDAVLSIVDGLSEEHWQSSVVPSGWTPAGFVAHLGGAERHWFQGVTTGDIAPHPWDDEDDEPYDPHAAFVCDKPGAEVVEFYREQCGRSDAVLAVTPLSATPIGTHPNPAVDVKNLRWIVLHMIEETSTHSGHLEIARELLDGSTGLGRR
jgi:hypothetical protein